MLYVLTITVIFWYSPAPNRTIRIPELPGLAACQGTYANIRDGLAKAYPVGSYTITGTCRPTRDGKLLTP